MNTQTITPGLAKKMIPNVFGKNIYLLGIDSYGVKYWLEAPSFDCGWYWGFGYVETYTNNANPANAKGISSHQHWGSIVSGDIKLVKSTFRADKTRVYELFAKFYALKEEADKLHNNCLKTQPKRYTVINMELIPAITKEILDILTPSK